MVLVRPASGSRRGSHTSTRLRGGVLAAALLAAACGDDGATDTGSPSPSSGPGQSDRESSTERDDNQQFPDVVNVEVERSGDTYDFEVTISSPYDMPERYADGWRVMDPDDSTVYGEHELAHDHANEQPFTRIQRGVEIPDGVDEVVIEVATRPTAMAATWSPSFFPSDQGLPSLNMPLVEWPDAGVDKLANAGHR